MTLVRQIAAIVAERGRASADDIHIDGKSRDQVIRALQNAATLGRVHLVQARSAGLNKGRAPSVYAAGPKPVVKTGAATSVWDWGRAVDNPEARPT